MVWTTVPFAVFFFAAAAGKCFKFLSSFFFFFFALRKQPLHVFCTYVYVLPGLSTVVCTLNANHEKYQENIFTKSVVFSTSKKGARCAFVHNHTQTEQMLSSA